MTHWAVGDLGSEGVLGEVSTVRGVKMLVLRQPEVAVMWTHLAGSRRHTWSPANLTVVRIGCES